MTFSIKLINTQVISMRYFALNTTNVANTQSLVRDAKNKRKLKKENGIERSSKQC